MHLPTKSFFLHYLHIQTIQLPHLLTNSLIHIDKQNIFVIVTYKNHLNWGRNEVMERISPIIQCCMAGDCLEEKEIRVGRRNLPK